MRPRVVRRAPQVNLTHHLLFSAAAALCWIRRRVSMFVGHFYPCLHFRRRTEKMLKRRSSVKMPRPDLSNYTRNGPICLTPIRLGLSGPGVFTSCLLDTYDFPAKLENYPPSEKSINARVGRPRVFHDFF